MSVRNFLIPAIPPTSRGRARCIKTATLFCIPEGYHQSSGGEEEH